MMTVTTVMTMIVDDDSDVKIRYQEIVVFCKVTGADLLAWISRECVVDVLCL